MQLSETHARGDHLDAVRRGAAFAICAGFALMFVWSWTANPTTTFADMHSIAARASGVVNAPASLSRSWLPVSLAIQPIGE